MGCRSVAVATGASGGASSARRARRNQRLFDRAARGRLSRHRSRYLGSIRRSSRTGRHSALGGDAQAARNDPGRTSRQRKAASRRRGAVRGPRAGPRAGPPAGPPAGRFGGTTCSASDSGHSICSARAGSGRGDPVCSARTIRCGGGDDGQRCGLAARSTIVGSARHRCCFKSRRGCSCGVQATIADAFDGTSRGRVAIDAATQFRRA